MTGMLVHGRSGLRWIAVGAFVWLFAGGAAGAGKPLDVCRLLSPATLESVQGSRPIATVPSSHEDATLRSSSCFYSLTPSNQSVNLQVMTAAGTTDIHQFWKQRFRPERKAEEPESDVGRKTGSGSEANERRAPAKPVPGVGEEAFWIYTGRDGAIYALQRDYVVRVSVGGKAEESSQRQRATELALSALSELSRR
jgi:hypothetical protein